jgi:hypothetical protein
MMKFVAVNRETTSRPLTLVSSTSTPASGSPLTGPT